MSRPLPTWPRGKRRRRRRAEKMLLGCPRVSPEFELSTVRALMKPKPLNRGAIEHQDGIQPWPGDADSKVDAVLQRLRDVGVGIELHRPASGEFHLLAPIPAEQLEEAKAIAVALSAAVPGCWFVLGQLFVRAGQFYRRRFGYRMEITRASDVHLTRPMRALVQQVAARPR